VAVYVVGVAALLLRLFVGTWCAWRLRHDAVIEDGRATSSRVATPITVGWLAPTLILPRGWTSWPRAQIDAVFTHEREHARRRDPLIQWLALLNRAVFWFHPLSWWLERRLATLAEEACDAAVLAAGCPPQEYSAYLLDLARSVAERGGRVRAVGMAMPGSGLKERMRQILSGAVAAPISRVRMACTVSLCMASTALFAGATLTPRTTSAVGEALLQPAGSAFPKFDVVSVRPCAPGAPSQTRGRTDGTGGAGGPITSPGRLYLQCYPLATMIPEAYLYFADGRAHGLDAELTVGVEGGPDWMKSDRFTIEATTSETPPPAVMRGPMLQAVLEDRFKLKVRRETRQMPVYELVAAMSGAKVSPYTGTDCVIRDNAAWPPPALPAGQRYCGDRSHVDGDLFVRTGVMTLDELAALFSFDRPVVNKTGITAPVSYQYGYPREDAKAGDAPPPSVVKAIRDQLGLDLRAAKGPREFLVIEHAEHPDFAAASAAASSRQAPAAAAAAAALNQTFDVVSIRPCSPDSAATATIPARPGFRGAGYAGAQLSPGLVRFACVTLTELTDQAYADRDHPLLNNASGLSPMSPLPKRVRGGPSWAGADRFAIEAKGEGVSAATLAPMLRAMLEDRFQLQVHRATEEQDMYALSVAKGGINTKTMTRPVPGDCMTIEEYAARAARQEAIADNAPICGRVFSSRDGQHYSSFRLSQLAADLPRMGLDRYVLDRTGLDGTFNFVMQRLPDDPAGADWVLGALGRLGLRLEATKGPAEYLVIDRAERPRPGSPADHAPPARATGPGTR